MSNEIDISINQLYELQKQTTFSLNTIAEQFGSLVSTVKNLQIDQRTTKAEIAGIKDDFNLFKEQIKQNEYISPLERENLATTMRTRVGNIFRMLQLSEVEYKRYFPPFMRKFWNDIKADACVAGTGGVYTKKMHYPGAIEYAGTWTPKKYGASGYIQYLS